MTIKYQNGAPADNAIADGEEGLETDDSPSKKTPKKANRSGRGLVKTEKEEQIAITAPRAAGVGKRRSPAKPKATGGLSSGITTSTFTTVGTDDGVDLMMGVNDGEAGDFVPSFFDEQMGRGHDDDTV